MPRLRLWFRFRRRALFLCIAVSFLSSHTLWSQQGIQRDPQALSILKNAFVAAGGIQMISAIQDFTANGSVTYYLDTQDSGTVVVKGCGIGQLRIDATLPEGTRTVLVNNGTGSITEPDGTIYPIPHQSAVNIGSMIFPFELVVSAFQNPSVSITYVGLVNHLGSQVHDIRFQTAYSKQVDPTGALTKASVRDFFIDPNSFLILSALDTTNTLADGSGGISHEIVFSNYQTTNGVAFPMWITESSQNEALMNLQLTQVSVNTGVNTSIFGN